MATTTIAAGMSIGAAQAADSTNVQTNCSRSLKMVEEGEGSIYAKEVDTSQSKAHRCRETANSLLRTGGTPLVKRDSSDGDFDSAQSNKTAEELERDRQAFAAHTKVIRRKFERMQRMTINPHSKRLGYWDSVTLSALLFTAFVTPFEVGFLDDDTSGDALFILNRLVDTVFVIDICVTFFTPFRASGKTGGMWVYNNVKIAKRYLKGWFLLDICTTIPFDLLFSIKGGDSGGNANVTRAIRVAHVVKLARIVRASRILKRWEDHIGISFAYLSLLQFLLVTLMMSHWLACIWGFVGGAADHLAMDQTPYTENLTVERQAEIRTEIEDYATSNWFKRARAWTKDPWELYGLSVYVALHNIFGGSSELQPGNYPEFYIQTTMLLVGSAVWAYIIGSICGIISTLNPVVVEYRQTMDQLNYFVDDQGVPEDLAVRLRNFFRNSRHLIRARRYDGLLGKMSTSLWGETSYYVAKKSLSQIPYLSDNDVEPEFLLAIAIKFKLMVYSRLEPIPVINLTVVHRGVSAKNGQILLAGSALGVDMVLSNPRLRDLQDGIALTFVQVQLLHAEDLFDTLALFPKAAKICRRFAFKHALRRCIIKAAKSMSDPFSFTNERGMQMTLSEAIDLNVNGPEPAANALADGFCGNSESRRSSFAGNPESMSRRSSFTPEDLRPDQRKTSISVLRIETGNPNGHIGLPHMDTEVPGTHTEPHQAQPANLLDAMRMANKQKHDAQQRQHDAFEAMHNASAGGASLVSRTEALTPGRSLVRPAQALTGRGGAPVSESRLTAVEAKLDKRADALDAQLSSLADQMRTMDVRLQQLLMLSSGGPKRKPPSSCMRRKKNVMSSGGEGGELAGDLSQDSWQPAAGKAGAGALAAQGTLRTEASQDGLAEASRTALGSEAGVNANGMSC